MEVGLVVLFAFLERNRPDLRLRRAWARLPFPRPSLAAGVPVPLALAGLDLRRWAVRLTTVLLAYLLWRGFAPALPVGNPYDGVNALTGFALAFTGLGVLAILAATSGRDRGEELIAALPAGPRSRVLGWVVLLAILALVEYAVLAVLRFGRDEPPYAALLPDAWELTQGPLMLFGGGLLGLLFARLLPAWVAAPVCVVLATFWVGILSSSGWGTTMLAPMLGWIQYREDSMVIVEPGSFAWHNAYLLGLCGLAIVAALLREPGRRGLLLLAGTAALVATVVAGALALP